MALSRLLVAGARASVTANSLVPTFASTWDTGYHKCISYNTMSGKPGSVRFNTVFDEFSKMSIVATQSTGHRQVYDRVKKHMLDWTHGGVAASQHH